MITVPTSAKNGSLKWGDDEVGHVGDISFDQPQELDVYASSSTGGQRTRLAGHQDSSGSFNMYVDPANYGITRGAENIMLLRYDTGSNAYNGPAIIGNITPAIPVDAGTKLVWAVQFGQKPDSLASSS